VSHLMRAVISDVEDERRKQNAKWGDVTEADRHMPMGTEASEVRRIIRDDAISRTQEAAAAGTITWMDILLEEVYEARAEDGSPENWPVLRNELIQSAAVLVAMVEAGDLRAGPGSTKSN
jgi:hypothetical protein